MSEVEITAMFKLKMYVPCITNAQDMVGRNCKRVPLIGLGLAIDSHGGFRRL